MSTDPEFVYIAIFLAAYYFFIILYLWLVVVRILRWVSLLQQKEYRWDRMQAFIGSRVGLQELARVINLALRKVNVRRPRFTKKASLIILGSLVMVLVLANVSVMWALIGYMIIPVVVGLVVLPINVITYGVQVFLERKAKALFDKARPVVIGITGSYGKTTTKILITELLKSKHNVGMSPKSYNTPLSLPMAMVKSYKGEEIMVLEFAAYKKGEIARMSGLFPPQMAVITGIAPQHVGLFGSIENIVEAKSELLVALPKGAKVFFNNSDKRVVEMVSRFKSLKKIAVDAIKPAYKSRLFGSLYTANVNLASAVASDFGLSTGLIEKGFNDFKPTTEFVRIIKLKNDIRLIDDGGTSNPRGFATILREVAKMKGKKMVVSAGIVDLGKESEDIHRKLAKKINETTDWFVHTSDLEATVLRQKLGYKYIRVNTADELRIMLKKLTKGDLLLIEGKLRADLQVVFNELIN